MNRNYFKKDEVINFIKNNRTKVDVIGISTVSSDEGKIQFVLNHKSKRYDIRRMPESYTVFPI